jgi:hypothetical protein
MIIARDGKLSTSTTRQVQSRFLHLLHTYNIFSTIEQKTLYSIRSCINWAFFGTRGPLKRSFHSRCKQAHYFFHYYTEGEPQL